MNNVNDYVELVKAPWGRMFYDLLFLQFDFPTEPRLTILDFGSGFGIASNHYAKFHDVISIEPNPEMLKHRRNEYEYRQITGGVEKLAEFVDNSFDVVLCPNVLEYIKNQEFIFSELMRVIKSGGILSLVKHNRAGRVFHAAAFWNDPIHALKLIEPNANDKSNYLGNQYIYSNADLERWASKNNASIKSIFGMRAFWALGQDNSVKYTDEWYDNMLKLEYKVSDADEYKKVAFFNHLLITKN